MAVPEYTKRAIAKYQAKFERVNINFPEGTKERIKTLTGESVSGYVKRLVDSDLNRLEKSNVSRAEENKDIVGEAEKSLDLSAYDKKKQQAEAERLAELQALIDKKRAELAENVVDSKPLEWERNGKEEAISEEKNEQTEDKDMKEFLEKIRRSVKEGGTLK